MSIPEQLFGDETTSNVRTPEGRQPAVQEPPPVEPGMGPPQQRYTSMGYAQPASSPMGGFAYSPTWGTRGPPPGPVPQLDMGTALNAGGRVSGQVATIERIQGENTDPLTSLNLPPPRPGSLLSSLLKSPAMNTPNWECTHAIHHSRTNFPVQLLSEMTMRLEDVIRIQECIPEDIAMVLREVLESMGIEILGDDLEFSDLQAIQILRNTNLAAVAAKINEESNEDVNAIAAKNRRCRRYTIAHLLAPVESMPDQDSSVRLHSRQTVYMYTPMRHMHQLLVRSEESEAMLCPQETRHQTLLAESDTLMLLEELSGSNLERALKFRRRLVADNRETSYMVQFEPENAGEFPLEQFDQKRQLHGSDGRFLAQKHSLPRNNEVPEFPNPAIPVWRVIPYQGLVSMQSQAVGAENQRGPNQRRMLAVHKEAVPPHGAPFGTPFVTRAQANQPSMAINSAHSQELVVMIQQQARVIETLQEQLREVRKGFTAGGIPTGEPLSKTANTAGLFGQAPMAMRKDTRGGPSPAVPQPRNWQATEPISFTRRTPVGVREGNPQEGQTAPLPATPSVDRRLIQEWELACKERSSGST
ncbi:hypothetical protein F5051DRAFT_430160 [Lentinula edodes]|nr:hypothetical protein F5051DRAFT_430160 [Lentinula edodes]